jgi:hypothetical protein
MHAQSFGEHTESFSMHAQSFGEHTESFSKFLSLSKYKKGNGEFFV